jgi:hypothetical protein
LPCKHGRQIPAAVESSGVPFQGGGGPGRTFRAGTPVGLLRSVYGMPHSLWGEQSKQKEKQEGVSRGVASGECSCVSGCVRCVRSMRAVFGGVDDRGYRSHGKESTKSDVMHRKSEALAWLVYRRFPGINLNVAQPGSVRSAENENGADGRRTAGCLCDCLRIYRTLTLIPSLSLHFIHRIHHR